MLLGTSKFHILHLGSKSKGFEYTMGGRALESEKDFGVLIHKSLKASLHCAKAAEKAKQILG